MDETLDGYISEETVLLRIHIHNDVNQSIEALRGENARLRYIWQGICVTVVICIQNNVGSVVGFMVCKAYVASLTNFQNQHDVQHHLHAENTQLRVDFKHLEHIILLYE